MCWGRGTYNLTIPGVANAKRPQTTEVDVSMRLSDQPAIERRIIGFHQDEHGDWVADLECGHTQHVRHDPPWQNRPWVVTPEGRQSHIGTTLYCVLCA